MLKPKLGAEVVLLMRHRRHLDKKKQAKKYECRKKGKKLGGNPE